VNRGKCIIPLALYLFAHHLTGESCVELSLEVKIRIIGSRDHSQEFATPSAGVVSFHIISPESNCRLPCDNIGSAELFITFFSHPILNAVLCCNIVKSSPKIENPWWEQVARDHILIVLFASFYWWHSVRLWRQINRAEMLLWRTRRQTAGVWKLAINQQGLRRLLHDFRSALKYADASGQIIWDTWEEVRVSARQAGGAVLQDGHKREKQQPTDTGRLFQIDSTQHSCHVQHVKSFHRYSEAENVFFPNFRAIFCSKRLPSCSHSSGLT